MSEPVDDLIKLREISFCTLHPDSRQAHSAASVLGEIEGVLRVEVDHDAMLRVEYHLRQVSLEEIEVMLESAGFHLDNRLVHKVRRALYRYTEEAQRANLGCETGDANSCTQKVFATSYKRRDHGCRDDRPEHWRRYL